MMELQPGRGRCVVSGVLQNPPRDTISSCCVPWVNPEQIFPPLLRSHNEGRLTWWENKPGAGGGVEAIKSVQGFR